MKKERIVAFIVARLSSSRFPGKQLREISGRKLLEWSLIELQKSEKIDKIVLATASEKENIPLRDFAEEHGHLHILV